MPRDNGIRDKVNGIESNTYIYNTNKDSFRQIIIQFKNHNFFLLSIYKTVGERFFYRKTCLYLPNDVFFIIFVTI